ncbi:hypothetical protein ACIOWM_37215 [Streptomyces anulatus]
MQAKQFVVAVEPEKLTRLDTVVKRHRDAEDEWLKQARKAARLSSLRGPDASAARQGIRLRRAELREHGELRGTRDLVIAHELRAVLRARKMDENWNAIPPKDSGAVGRPFGASSDRYPRTAEDEPALSARMPIRLPAELGEQVVRGCYWTSAPAVQALKAWQRRWGDGPVVILKEAQRQHSGAVGMGLATILAGMAPRATREALEERIALQDQVITSGDLIREAVDRAIR